MHVLRALPWLLLANCAQAPSKPGSVPPAEEPAIDAVLETPPPEAAWPQCCAGSLRGGDPGKPIESGRIRCNLQEGPATVAVLRWVPAQPPGDEQRIDMTTVPSEFVLPVMVQSQALPPTTTSLRWKLSHAGQFSWRVRTRYGREWVVSPAVTILGEACPQVDEVR